MKGLEPYSLPLTLARSTPLGRTRAHGAVIPVIPSWPTHFSIRSEAPTMETNG